MPCSSYRQALSQPCPNSLAHSSNGLGRCWPHSTRTGAETYRPTASASATGGARDRQRRNARAAVMQVRPLSVVSGAAGSSPFGSSPFSRSGRL